MELVLQPQKNKVVFISHRGNTKGPDPSKENSPDYVLDATRKGNPVEIDVWFKGNNFFLGHSSPMFQVPLDFLKNTMFLCHAKNIEALQVLNKNSIHCFWHIEDDFTLTSQNKIIVHEKNQDKISFINNPNLIIVNLGKYPNLTIGSHAVCSDFSPENL